MGGDWMELPPGHYISGKHAKLHQFALTPEQLQVRVVVGWWWGGVVWDLGGDPESVCVCVTVCVCWGWAGVLVFCWSCVLPLLYAHRKTKATPPTTNPTHNQPHSQPTQNSPHDQSQVREMCEDLEPWLPSEKRRSSADNNGSYRGGLRGVRAVEGDLFGMEM